LSFPIKMPIYYYFQKQAISCQLKTRQSLKRMILLSHVTHCPLLGRGAQHEKYDCLHEIPYSSLAQLRSYLMSTGYLATVSANATSSIS
jgi:hypothetical protein